MRYRVYEATGDISSAFPSGNLRNQVPYLLSNGTKQAIECFADPPVPEPIPNGVNHSPQKPLMFLTKRMLKFLELEPGDKIRNPELKDKCISCSFHVLVVIPDEYLNLETVNQVGHLTSFQEAVRNRVSLPKFSDHEPFVYTDTITLNSNSFNVKVTFQPMIKRVPWAECYARSSYYNPTISDVWKFSAASSPILPVSQSFFDIVQPPYTHEAVKKFLGIHSGFQSQEEPPVNLIRN
jgi:hypothetical protein